MWYLGGSVMDEGVSWGGEMVREVAMAMERVRSTDEGEETARTGLALSLIGSFSQARVISWGVPMV